MYYALDFICCKKHIQLPADNIVNKINRIMSKTGNETYHFDTGITLNKRGCRINVFFIFLHAEICSSAH